MRKLLIVLACLLTALPAFAQQQPQPPPQRDESADRAFEETIKDIDDVRWFMYLGDVGKIDKSLIVHGDFETSNAHIVRALMDQGYVVVAPDAGKAAGKKFEYKVYENAPGGHHFNRIDTKFARESRAEVYAFLARYLK